MLRVGQKRRRTQKQIEQDKEEAELKQADIDARLAQLKQMHQQASANQDAREVLDQMLNAGVAEVQANGTITVPSASKQKP